MRRLCLIALALSLAACGDDDPAPLVVVLEATPEVLDPGDDAANDLSILVEYRDADGDLGGGTAEVHDCRAEDLFVALAIPPIASQAAIDEGVPIEGQLQLVVTDIGAITPSTTASPVCADLGIGAGETVFCVVLTDAAGNTGPGDCTPTLSIL
jgi:hypothetical protein